MLRKGVLIASLLALAVPAHASAGAKQADARLERALDNLVRMTDGPAGVAATVQRGKNPKFHVAGVADRATGAPWRFDDHLRIASVTKAFTGAVTLKLVEQGKLRLNSTIGEVLPTLPAAWHPMTVTQLLQHTSGIPNYTAAPAFQKYLPDHLDDFVTPQQIIDFAATEPVEFPPGTKYEYSNTGTIVLGLMAERVTGISYADNLQRLVLNPLGLRATSLPYTTLLIPDPFVRGYVYAGPGQPQEEVSSVLNPSGVWAAGAIISTPRDLNTFIRAWGGGDFLKKPAVRLAQTTFYPPFSGGEPIGPGVNRGGLTLYRYKTPCGIVFGHTGNFPGYTNWIAASRDGSRSAVVNTNLQVNIPDKALPEVSTALRRVFRRAACAALARP